MSHGKNSLSIGQGPLFLCAQYGFGNNGFIWNYAMKN